MSSRTFTVAGSDINWSGGIYKPQKNGLPGPAAKKAAKTLFKMVENKDNKPEWRKYEAYRDHKTIKFILRETTMGSSKKSYYYEAKVQHLKTPLKRVVDGVEILYHRKIVVKTCQDGIRTVGSTAKSA